MRGGVDRSTAGLLSWSGARSIVVLPSQISAMTRTAVFRGRGHRRSDDRSGAAAECSVISRSTAFTYKGQQVDASRSGRELGVRYVLEGSVRRSGNHGQGQRPADRRRHQHASLGRAFDHDIGDLFALQNEVTSRIANTLGWELLAAETADDRATRRARLPAAGARREWRSGREKLAERVDLFEHCSGARPWLGGSAEPLSERNCRTRFSKDPLQWLPISNAPTAACAGFRDLSGDPYAHFVKGRSAVARLRAVRGGDSEFEIALPANRNNPYALSN